MKKVQILVGIGVVLLIAVLVSPVLAAYNHAGEADAPNFLLAYPKLAGTKLDNCTLCHTGGSYISSGKTTTLGSCQWCHYKYGYNKSGDITATLNTFGKDYLAQGRNKAAFAAIEAKDSDGDGFTNIAEINAIRYPGDATDDPTKIVAPFRIYTKAQLQAMPQSTQFMLMNTTKSGDSYGEYSGVVMQDLLKTAGMTSTATKITVYAPDGFAQGHPLEDSALNIGSSYSPFVNGTYPAATYYYDTQADKALNAASGWCDYSSPRTAGRKHGDALTNTNGLRLLLALKAEGKDLVPGVMDATNRLTTTSEGPFRTISPQKVVGPPDQASTSANQAVKWPYDTTADHNAGFSSKCATIVKVEPLPTGTTDINVLESGWNYIDQQKIVIYGALAGPAIITPADGEKNVAGNGATLTWNKIFDPDPAAGVTYTLELSKDQVTWTALKTMVASADKSQKPVYAGAVPFMYFGFAGIIGLLIPPKNRKSIGMIFLIMTAGLVIYACGGGTTDSVQTTMGTTITQPLDAKTTYYLRITADGPNSHSTSVSSFTTG